MHLLFALSLSHVPSASSLKKVRGRRGGGKGRGREVQGEREMERRERGREEEGEGRVGGGPMRAIHPAGPLVFLQIAPKGVSYDPFFLS